MNAIIKDPRVQGRKPILALPNIIGERDDRETVVLSKAGDIGEKDNIKLIKKRLSKFAVHICNCNRMNM